MRTQTRTAAVTGAAGGIGLALGARFVRAGAGVVMADVEGDAPHRRAAELTAQDGQVTAATADLTDPDAVERLTDTAFDLLGDIDVACNFSNSDAPLRLRDQFDDVGRHVSHPPPAPRRSCGPRRKRRPWR